MANTYTDDVALLKQELSQFLLAEIASGQGGTAFKREVGDQVAAVIDQLLDARLKPLLERQAEEQARQTRQMIDAALRDVPQASGVSEKTLADMAGRLEDLRQRLARMEDAARPRPVATAQPMRAVGRAEDAPERVPLAAPSASGFPTWVAYVLLLLALLIAAGVGNLYYEKYIAATPAIAPQAARVGLNAVVPPPAAASTAAPAAPKPAADAPPRATPQPTVSVPPQNPVAIAPATPPSTQAVTPHAPPRATVPADIAIERGWLAAQPYAVDSRLARRVGVSDAVPTLKTMICGSSPVCSSDSLFNGSSDARQLIALQMVMSQIGDRFCSPRRSIAVNGSLTATGLADLSAIADCAGGAAASCRESQNRVCPPDADFVQAGSPAARAAMLRWALWRTGSS